MGALKYIKMSITFKELHEKRIKAFKQFLNDNVNDDKLRDILVQFSNMTIPFFMSKVKEIILPNRDKLLGFITQLCSESDIDINKFNENTRNKLIRYLEYFCDSCEEYFK